MPTIAILATHRNGHHPDPGIRAVEAAGGRVSVVTPTSGPDELADAGGLLVPDTGFDSNGPNDGALALLEAAMAADMPTLLTGRGMYLLNSGFGGGWPETSEAPSTEEHDDPSGRQARRQIYLSPGSKMAAIVGSAGMFRVNNGAWNRRLALKEAQRSERLMSIAYQLDDGVIEGLESKEHSWVIAVQFLPERADEVPASFNNLFLGLVERAEDFTATGDNQS